MKHLSVALRAALPAIEDAEAEQYIRDIDPLGSFIGTPGDDSLTGTNARDTLDGGLGADTMAGGKNDDTYYVDDVGDVVVEAADGGFADRVISTVDYVMGDYIDELKLIGAADLSATGNAYGNEINGNDGNNVIDGMGSRDVLRGGKGNDTIYGGEGFDDLYGDSGDDVLVDEDPEASILSGGAGDDTLRGVGWLNGDDGNDVLIATPGDTLFLNGGNGDDRLIGSTAADSLYGDTGSDRVSGGAGNDLVVDEDSEADTFSGGEGIDTLSAKWTMHGAVVWINKPGQAQSVAGHVVRGFENLSLTLSDGNDIINNQASSGYTNLVGGDGDDQLRGGAGGDTMSGGIGNDTLAGGSGYSDLRGGTGDDRLYGGQGDDKLAGDVGLDRMYGGDGNDVIDDASWQGGAHEAAYVDGGAGLDICIDDFSYLAAPITWINDASATVIVGEDTITGIECLRLELTSGNDYIDNTAYAVNDSLKGADGNDTLLGGGGSSDTLDGGAGNDTLISGPGGGSLLGGSGNDLVDGSASLGGYGLYGGEGADTIIGSAGNDDASGGAHADWISTGAGNDTISSWEYEGEGDTLDGGSGVDTLEIYAATGLVINWHNDPSQAQVVGRQTIISMEAMDVNGSDSSDVITNLLTTTDDRVDGEDGNDTIELGAGDDTIWGWNGNDVMAGGAGNDLISCSDSVYTTGTDSVVLDSLIGFDTVVNFTSPDRLSIRQSSLAVGDGDVAVEGATVKVGPGGYAASAELVIATQNIDGELTAEAAAARIGQANSAFADGQTAIFVVDNGSDTGVYYFESAGADAQVSAAELTLLAVLDEAMTSIGSYQFGS